MKNPSKSLCHKALTLSRGKFSNVNFGVFKPTEKNNNFTFDNFFSAKRVI